MRLFDLAIYLALYLCIYLSLFRLSIHLSIRICLYDRCDYCSIDEMKEGGWEGEVYSADTREMNKMRNKEGGEEV